MIISVAILSAVLGIVIGFLMARVKNAQQVSDAKQAGATLETQVAVLRNQLESESRKVGEVKVEADRRLAESKADTAKMLADEKASAAKILAEEKASSAKLLESTKQEMDYRQR